MRLTRYNMYRIMLSSNDRYDLYLQIGQWVTFSIILSSKETSHTKKIDKGWRRYLIMLHERQHQITVSIRLLRIGEMTIHGKSHPVTPLELVPNGLVFLCPWKIPIQSNVLLGYVIDDRVDHLLLTGTLEDRGLFQGHYMYRLEFEADREQKSRIIGMLNRMMLQELQPSRLKLYS